MWVEGHCSTKRDDNHLQPHHRVDDDYYVIFSV